MSLRGSNKRSSLDFVEEKQYALNVREMRASVWKKRGADGEASMRNDNAAFGLQKNVQWKEKSSPNDTFNLCKPKIDSDVYFMDVWIAFCVNPFCWTRQNKLLT